MGIMNSSMITVAFLISHLIFGQIMGTVTDESNGEAIPYVNVWLKNKLIGATTDNDGRFSIERGRIGDTLYISSLGYTTKEFSAKKENPIILTPEIVELDEVLVTPIYRTKAHIIESFTKAKKNRAWYNNGHYSLARFYEYKDEYSKTPFIGNANLLTNNANKDSVILAVRLVKVRANGEPSDIGLTENIIVKSGKGINIVRIELSSDKILIPKDGFFVVVDRLNIEANKFYNKFAKMDVLQPAIGIERIEQIKNTWFGFGGNWIPPTKMNEFVGTNDNIAINITLTN